MTNDIITVKIKSSSQECEQIRDNGQFFEAIADALCITRDDVEEIIQSKT